MRNLATTAVFVFWLCAAVCVAEPNDGRAANARAERLRRIREERQQQKLVERAKSSEDSEEANVTLARCAEELRPEQPVELRRRAVLVAGKYLTETASELLGQCLADEDAVVRRNALVSIGEEQVHLRRNRLGVLQCLRDGEVNIRRLASSLLGEVLRGVWGASASNGAASAAVPKDFTGACLNVALGDEDAEVRRNVLNALQEGSFQLRGAVLAPFLREASPATVILAIKPYLMSDALMATQVQVLSAVAARPEREIRLALADALPEVPEPGLQGLYAKLAADEIPEVRSRALLGLLRLEPCEAKWNSAAVQLVLSEVVASEERVHLLEALRGVQPEQLWAVVGPLLERRQPSDVRLAAWQQLLRHRELQVNLTTPRLLEAMVSEENALIQRVQQSILRLRQEELRPEDFTVIQGSPLPAVRRLALGLSASLPREERLEVIFSALLDEAVQVRAEAVRLLASLRPPEWRQLLCDSLEEAGVIAAAAARGLLPVAAEDEEVASALRSYLSHCTEEALRKQISERLTKKSGRAPQKP